MFAKVRITWSWVTCHCSWMSLGELAGGFMLFWRRPHSIARILANCVQFSLHRHMSNQLVFLQCCKCETCNKVKVKRAKFWKLWNEFAQCALEMKVVRWRKYVDMACGTEARANLGSGNGCCPGCRICDREIRNIMFNDPTSSVINCWIGNICCGFWNVGHALWRPDRATLMWRSSA